MKDELVEIAKVLCSGTVGFAAMLTDIELVLKIIIAAMTICYIGLKIEKLWRERKVKS